MHDSYSTNLYGKQKAPSILRPTLAISLFLLLYGLTSPQGHCRDNWNQFRGMGRDGRIHLAGDDMIVPTPELLWSQEIGPGFSEVVIYEEILYLMMGEKIDSLIGWETLVAMDAATGERLWSTRIDTIYIDVDDWGDGPRSTPAVDQQNIYCFSASGKLAALNRMDGEIIWSVDFVNQYGSTCPRWGYSSSPLLVDDLLMIEVGGKDDHGFAAFDKFTGALRWHNSNIATAYNSPIAIEVNGVKQVIFTSGKILYAFDLAGDSLWSHTMPLRSPMALPLFIEPDLLFVSAANDAGSFIIKMNNGTPEEIMKSSLMRNDFSSSCYKDGYIYGFNVATLQCIDATSGERKWLKRGFGKGSLVLIGNHLYVLSDLGVLTLVEATAEEYRETATTEVLEGRSWTAPSYSAGRLYLRNHTRLACLRIMQKSK